MATGYISEAVPELGGLYKFGICYGRDKTYYRFYSMWSKHDYPMLSVKKEIVLPENFVPELRELEKKLKAELQKFKNVVYRKKHIYTIIGERTYNHIGDKDGAANGGTEFFLLNKKQVKYIMESLDELYNRLMHDTNWFKPSNDFKPDGSE